MNRIFNCKVRASRLKSIVSKHAEKYTNYSNYVTKHTKANKKQLRIKIVPGKLGQLITNLYQKFKVFTCYTYRYLFFAASQMGMIHFDRVGVVGTFFAVACKSSIF